ncbi:hypothetical protein [Pediococcus pentosaceus]|uniref:hypothetical protein n=1 Tax=Pediococcus pentosaceus TaxID=1255 RepID=UPI00223BD7D2|nr:hypothetical protein [Pediococcus pentosaceus]MCT1175228.1 hypothetical protein [Pediococcus pentosaceus]
MSIFGKKQKDGAQSTAKNPRKKKDKRKAILNKRTFKNPPDAKLFYRMPLLLAIGLICIMAGLIIMWRNDTNYNQKIMSSSLPKGSELPVRDGTASEGTLKLGSSLLSADGKTLAVEIQYDDDAHNSLSSFGDNYNLYLIDTENYQMKGTKLSYGMFGTDGSGVLKIHRDKGFENKAFMVFLIDKGVIVSNDKLNTSRTMTDDEIDKSLAKQLEEVEADSSSDDQDSTAQKDALPPTFMIRLNGHTTKKAYRNWHNDSEIVEDLFVDHNLKKIKKNQQALEKKYRSGERSLDEMNERLEKNKNDSVAQSNKQELEQTLKGLKAEIKSAKSNYERISNSNIKANVLAPKQHSFKRYTVKDINAVK